MNYIFTGFWRRCLFFGIAFFALHALAVGTLLAQTENKVDFRGYIKNMQTFVFPGDDVILLENLVHNRLNFRYYANDNFYIAAEARNRVFAGNITALTPDFGNSIQQSADDWLPLSVLWLDGEQYAVHSTLDRFFVDYTHKKWNIRAGRQRVNWGINLAFNPNDLFNAYNFLDFDYEERPGSDAIRIQYFRNYASGMDIAVKGADNMDDFVAALRWYSNIREFDFQFIGGLSRGDLALGAGWAGQIIQAGWKGELTFFYPVLGVHDEIAFSATTGIDHTFGKGWYVYSGYLFNSDASASLSDLLFGTDALSARNLFPFKHSLITQLSYPASPIVSISSAVIYAPSREHVLVFNPSVNISLADNWNLDMVWQSFLTLNSNTTALSSHVAFFRVQWSF